MLVKKFLVKKTLMISMAVGLSLMGSAAVAHDMSQHQSHATTPVTDSSEMSPSMSQSVSETMSHANGHAMNHTAQAMASEVVTAGVVKAVLADTRQLKVQHQAIPEWDMGAMQMKFGLAEGISPAQFSDGQQIKFRLRQEHMMTYVITEVLEK